jgi:hypothetical protein
MWTQFFPAKSQTNLYESIQQPISASSRFKKYDLSQRVGGPAVLTKCCQKIIRFFNRLE